MYYCNQEQEQELWQELTGWERFRRLLCQEKLIFQDMFEQRRDDQEKFRRSAERKRGRRSNIG